MASASTEEFSRLKRKRNRAIAAAVAGLLVSIAVSLPRTLTWRRDLEARNVELLAVQVEINAVQKEIRDAQVELNRVVAEIRTVQANAR